MEFFGTLVHALFQPVNCVANFGSEVLVATGHLVNCVGLNLMGATSTVLTSSGDAVSNVGTAIGLIGG